MNSEELRKSFLDFFKSKGHTIVLSSSLIPDDPSVLLTTAGMQQFKKYYTGELDAMSDFQSQRTASAQKSFRTSDIEEVGDKTHLTFFEMLGNFSFGPVGSDRPDDLGTDGYFKRSSIHWAYEYITKVLNIGLDRIYVTVFEGNDEVPFDEESYKIWHEEIKMPKEKIVMGNRADNFWGPTGDSGPCGPTTEIYVDGVEVWNVVFNEYFQEKGGKLRKVENPGVDTGMGFERLLSVLQAKESVFETDVFRDLVSKIKELAPSLENKENIVRIFADHLRGSIFLIADGIRPSNKEAGYVLRRLIRRLLAYEVKYDIHSNFFPEAIKIIKNKFVEVYPELNNDKIILDVLEDERTKYQEAISLGAKEIERLNVLGEKITGAIAFNLYQTFSISPEITLELAKNVDKDNFQKEFDQESKKHQEISRAGVEKKFGGHGLVLDTGELKAGSEEEMKKVIRLHTATHLLHQALRDVLGDGVEQRGSDINPERARFDFLFNRKLTADELKKVEEIVNEKINQELPVRFKEMLKEDAEKTGARKFFKGNYPPTVKVYYIGSEDDILGAYSKEFCGGPHVENTSEIGKFKIIKEEASSAGVRRIRAAISG